jgi:hypothetical protein
MGLKPRYHPDRKELIIAALQAMLNNLLEELRIEDKVSFDVDTIEIARTDLADFKLSEAELAEDVQQRRDDSTKKLGHMQKRIEELRALKEAFEGSDIPAPQILQKTYVALRSSLLHEAMNLSFGNPLEQIIETGVQRLGKEKAEEIRRIGKTIDTYVPALMWGFNMNPFMWNEFPFDTP